MVISGRNILALPSQIPVRYVKFFETLRILTIILLLTSLSAVGQTLPDSVVIINNTYFNNFSGSDNLYRSDKYSIFLEGKDYFLNGNKIAKSKIISLLAELTKQNNADNSLAKYGIDTNWIKNNPTELLSNYSDKKRIEWNVQQKQFIFKELTNLTNYNTELNYYISSGNSYTMHNSYKIEFIINFYNKENISSQIKSRKYVWGYKMPWTNLSGDLIYNYNIETKLKSIISSKEKTKEPLQDKKLLKYLVNKIVDNYMPTLYKYSAYSYQPEIDELKSDFEIISFEEVYGRGRYIWDEPKTMKVLLKNPSMLNNINLAFLASKQGNTIYSRDSIKKDYKEIIERIQSISFITDYLKNNPTSKLDIYYFNNKGINKYNINSVNKNPTEWKKHDAFLESIKKYDTAAIKPSYANEDAIRVSKEVYCGCNYRFAKDYIEKAIFFEINDTTKNNSIWFLLPDNKILLYLMQGDKVLNYDYKDFGKFRGIQYPCKLFDIKGQMISK